MGSGVSGAEVVVVTVTTPDEALAASIGDRLVADGMAACAQVGGPIRSTYRWEGAVETAQEWVLTLKTGAGRLDEVVAVVGAMHPYDVPEIVAVRAVGGNGDYLRWVLTESS